MKDKLRGFFKEDEKNGEIKHWMGDRWVTVKPVSKAQRKRLRRKARKQRKAKPTTTIKARSFYTSWEWKKARYETLKKYGPVCMLCGSDYRIVVDHIKPVKKFPELALDPDNLQVLCNDCNMGKSNTDYSDFRPTESPEESEMEIVFAAMERIH